MLGALRRSLKTFSDHLIDSPCIAVCKMDDRRDFCTGCHRSLDEITNWAVKTGAEKKAIILQAAARKRASSS